MPRTVPSGLEARGPAALARKRSQRWRRGALERRSSIDDDDVERLAKQIHDRVLRLLRRQSLLTDEHEISTEESEEHQGLLPLLQAASIQGRLDPGPRRPGPRRPGPRRPGPRRGTRIVRLALLGGGEVRITPGSLCAEVLAAM